MVDPAEEFLIHWFEIWLEDGIAAADRHFPNAPRPALDGAKAAAYSFMDDNPEAVPPERWAERRAEQC